MDEGAANCGYIICCCSVQDEYALQSSGDEYDTEPTRAGSVVLQISRLAKKSYFYLVFSGCSLYQQLTATCANYSIWSTQC